jgi:UDP-N-acetylmuramate--alanine ligase
MGISVVHGHDAAHVEGARAVVVTSAVPRDHPELAAAREKGIPVIRRAEALAEAVSVGEVVAVAGTHGKTTTTVMTTEALGAAGLEPTGIVGGRVAAWNGNLSAGSDRLFVVEADEYDRSFLALTPTVAVVTSVEADHLDIYRDLADIRETFARFARDARAIVLCADDAGATSLPTPATAEVVRYGISSTDARLVAREVVVEPGGEARISRSTTANRCLWCGWRCRAGTTCSTRSRRSPAASCSARIPRRWRAASRISTAWSAASSGWERRAGSS